MSSGMGLGVNSRNQKINPAGGTPTYIVCTLLWKMQKDQLDYLDYLVI